MAGFEERDRAIDDRHSTCPARGAMLARIATGRRVESDAVRAAKECHVDSSPMTAPGLTRSLLHLIGGTPLLDLARLRPQRGGRIWAKLEYLNPSGSVKDRIALAMLEAAERSGDLRPGGTVVEPTSGNTGIALAWVCALKGYRMIAVIPAAMSRERVQMLEALGADVDVVPARRPGSGQFTVDDIEATVARARDLVAGIPGAFMPNQFENDVNPLAHAETTGREILAQAGDACAAFVAAVGTGGTLTGVAAALKRARPDIRIVAVEPATSAVLSGCCPGFHGQQGIGEGFVPKVLRTDVLDDIIAVSDEEAIAMARRLAREEGVLAGFSAGANVVAARRVAETLAPEQAVVTLIPDSGLRYFSTDLFRVNDRTPGRCE
jgi:cysteine synthase A